MNPVKNSQPKPAGPPPVQAPKGIKIDSKLLRWILMGGLIFSVIIFLAAASYGLSVLGGKSNKLVDLKVRSQTADNQLSNLEQSKKEVEKYSYFRSIANTVIPSDKDQAEAVLEIFQIANQSGISIQSITFPASTLGLRAATTAPQDATSNAASRTAITQAIPVTGISGLYSLELTITPETGVDVPPAKQVTYPKILDFLKRIETNRHTAQITQVNIIPGNNGQSLSFTLTINIFIKP